MKQAELARRIGVTPMYVSYLERGVDPSGISETLLPTVALADAIATALNMTVQEVRSAAGLTAAEDLPEDASLTISNGFKESDFAALHLKYESLTPEQRENLRPVLEMIDRELDRLNKN